MISRKAEELHEGDDDRKRHSNRNGTNMLSCSYANRQLLETRIQRQEKINRRRGQECRSSQKRQRTSKLQLVAGGTDRRFDKIAHLNATQLVPVNTVQRLILPRMFNNPAASPLLQLSALCAAAKKVSIFTVEYCTVKPGEQPKPVGKVGVCSSQKM